MRYGASTPLPVSVVVGARLPVPVAGNDTTLFAPKFPMKMDAGRPAADAVAVGVGLAVGADEGIPVGLAVGFGVGVAFPLRGWAGAAEPPHPLTMPAARARAAIV